jgi:hypothetical protein
MRSKAKIEKEKAGALPFDVVHFSEPLSGFFQGSRMEISQMIAKREGRAVPVLPAANVTQSTGREPSTCPYPVSPLPT